MAKVIESNVEYDWSMDTCLLKEIPDVVAQTADEWNMEDEVEAIWGKDALKQWKAGLKDG